MALSHLHSIAITDTDINAEIGLAAFRRFHLGIPHEAAEKGAFDRHHRPFPSLARRVLFV
jgi:hypothetical protein